VSPGDATCSDHELVAPHQGRPLRLRRSRSHVSRLSSFSTARIVLREGRGDLSPPPRGGGGGGGGGLVGGGGGGGGGGEVRMASAHEFAMVRERRSALGRAGRIAKRRARLLLHSRRYYLGAEAVALRIRSVYETLRRSSEIDRM